VLATWLGVGGDRTSLLAAVQDEDEPHTVHADGAVHRLPAYLDAVLAECGPSCDAATVLPVPGDPTALGPAVAAQAIEAGEVVLLRSRTGSRALVPMIRRFGSALEPGHHVTWLVSPVLDWRRAVLAQVGTPGEADRALQAELRTATSALLSLDVSHWWPEVAAQVDLLRDASLPVERLPPGLEPSRLRMLTMAARLRAIIDLAVRDQMLPASVFVADQRTAALREIDRAARRAISAASTYVSEPARS
jgi:hypothetical protein